ncbi:MAG: hypothetical protein AB7O39_00645 [Flavobacteriaceae bacterium]
MAVFIQMLCFAIFVPFNAFIRMLMHAPNPLVPKKLAESPFGWMFDARIIGRKIGRRDVIADWVRQRFPRWFGESSGTADAGSSE